MAKNYGQHPDQLGQLEQQKPSPEGDELVTDGSQADSPQYLPTDYIEGLVNKLWVEQEEDRDQAKFTLVDLYTGEEIDYTFAIYLDVNTEVSLAQFGLLRDSMKSDWLVETYSSLMESGVSRQIHRLKCRPQE